MTVTIPVVVHMRDLDRGEYQVFKQVVKLHIGAEGGPLGVEGDGPAIGDVVAAHDCLRSAEITEEMTALCGRHMFQEFGDSGEYLKQKSSMKG